MKTANPVKIPPAPCVAASAMTSRSLWKTVPLLLAAALAQAAEPTPLDNAQALWRAGKTAEAQTAFEAIVKQDPKNIPAAAALSNLVSQRGDEDKATEILEKMAKALPQSSEAQRTLGEGYGRAAQKAGIFSKYGLAKKCLTAFQRAVELDPRSIPARQSLYDFYRQAPGIAGGSEEKAAEQIAEVEKLALEIKQTDPARARPILATVYVAQKKFDQAFAEYEEVLKAAPDDYNALYQVGRLAAITGQKVDAGLVALRRCLELTPPPNTASHAAAHWRIGNLLEKKNDPAGARVAYEAALKLDPKFNAAAEALKKLK